MNAPQYKREWSGGLSGASADASCGAAGSLGSAACRPGAGMFLSMSVCSAVSGLSENLSVVLHVHNSGVAFSEATLARQ